MPVVTNGDFSAGLTGWTVTQGGSTAPTVVDGAVVYGSAGDVQNGDQLIQTVALVAGQEYTLTFTISAEADSYGGYGLNVQLQDITGSSGFFNIGSATVNNGDTNTVSFTFTSPYDSPSLIIRGQYGFGPTGPNATTALILDDISITCFARDTLIRTPRGEIAVQDLQAGDLVETLDDGACPIRWVGSRLVSPDFMRIRPELRPILVPAGALGDGLPLRDLLLSPAHRVLVRGNRLELLFGTHEGLIPVRMLVGHIDGVRVVNEEAALADGVEYFHILFDQHQIIWSEGAETESFHPAARTVSALDEATRAEFLQLFPEMADSMAFQMETARPVLKSHEARLCLAG